MKVAYLSHICYSDVDISYIYHLRNVANVYLFLTLNNSTKAAAINLGVDHLAPGIYPASSFPELAKFSNLINLENTYIISRAGKSNLKKYHDTFELIRFFRNQHIDVLHFTYELRHYEWPLFLCRNKMIMSVHDPFPHSSVACNRFTNFYRKVSFKFSKNFILFNQSQKNEFINQYKLYHKRVYSSALSAYTYLQSYRPQNNLYGDYALYFGTIHSHKGLEYLLPAFLDFHRIHPHYKLIVAGKGNFYFDITNYLSEKSIVILNRFIPDEELSTLIYHSKFIVCPYKDATQSGVIMSAYAFAKPVIATDVGGLPEMVVHNKYGLIVPSCNEKVICDAMHICASQPDMIDKFSLNIQKDYVNGDKSWKYIAEKMITYYKDIIK